MKIDQCTCARENQKKNGLQPAELAKQPKLSVTLITPTRGDLLFSAPFFGTNPDDPHVSASQREIWLQDSQSRMTTLTTVKIWTTTTTTCQTGCCPLERVVVETPLTLATDVRKHRGGLGCVARGWCYEKGHQFCFRNIFIIMPAASSSTTPDKAGGAEQSSQSSQSSHATRSTLSTAVNTLHDDE
jgi:hypothetical protein